MMSHTDKESFIDEDHDAGSISYDDSGLQIQWVDGTGSRFPALWLRDNIPGTRHQDHGQRIVDAMDLAQNTTLRAAHLSLNRKTVALLFAPEPLKITFDIAWLRRHKLPDDNRPAPEPQPWDHNLLGKLHRTHFTALTTGDGVRDEHQQALRGWLRAIRDDGVALLHGVPTEPGKVCQVAQHLGYVRETNYGRLFNVVQEQQPDNLAFSNTGLGLHTDNPYRDPVPGLQLLHCLVTSADGGETLIADGFKAARELREQWPEDFATLTQHSVLFRYQTATVDLQARAPLIEVDEHQHIKAVRYNNRSIAPLDLPAPQVERFYQAYRRFGRALHADTAIVSFTLQPGDLLVMDNQRVLHGRRGFAGGKRHLQGCYADKDTLLSRLRLLEQNPCAIQSINR